MVGECKLLEAVVADDIRHFNEVGRKARDTSNLQSTIKTWNTKIEKMWTAALFNHLNFDIDSKTDEVALLTQHINEKSLTITVFC